MLVAASTVGADDRLLAVALEALAGEPVRVLATQNRRGAEWPGAVPANAEVTDWVSYAQAMPRGLARRHGRRPRHGHARAGRGRAGPRLPGRRRHRRERRPGRVGGRRASPCRGRWFVPCPLRRAVRRALAGGRYAERAREIAAWSRAHDGAERGAELVERFARGRG